MYVIQFLCRLLLAENVNHTIKKLLYCNNINFSHANKTLTALLEYTNLSSRTAFGQNVNADIMLKLYFTICYLI